MAGEVQVWWVVIVVEVADVVDRQALQTWGRRMLRWRQIEIKRQTTRRDQE